MISFTSKTLFRVIFFVGLCCGVVLTAQATHIKAGDIKAERTSSVSLSYKFTLNLYTKTSSNIPADKATLNFGDGNYTEVTRSQLIPFDNDTEQNVYVFFHTYSGPGFYKAGYQEQNRIASIINMSNSVGTPFYVEIGLSIDPLLGLNNSPVLSVPPIDKGAIGKIFTHNPGAYDPDGDSLAFSFYTPESAKGVFVLNYKAPDQFGGTSTLGGAPFITINPISGDIVWNAPSAATSSGSLPRFYNIAIRIDEFRAGVRIGYVIRDMQIEIDDTPNVPPVLKLPSDTCIVAGTWLRDTITASHPSSPTIFLESYSGIYTLPTSPAVYPPVTINNNTAHPVLIVDWHTTCDHIRKQPYDVVFKATDNSTVDPKLTDVRSTLIYVKAPKPQNLLSAPAGNGIKLTWSSYRTNRCSNADSIKIYRKECSTANITPEPCDDGVPATSGYKLIKEIKLNGTATDSIFTDTNNGAGLTPGVIYCYTIVATFALPAGGQSYPSNETCNQIAVDVPVLAAASVTATDPINGMVVINWFNPLDGALSAPFTYNLYRASSDAPTVFTKVNTAPITDTFYTDVNLNTTDKQYFYKTIEVRSATYAPVQSTVAFTALPLNNAAQLYWNIVTASNLDTVEVYRSVNGGAYQKVATLLNKQKKDTYTDSGIGGFHNCDTLEYYLKIKARYCDPRIPKELYSLSPIRQVIPLDDAAPRAPRLTLKSCAAPYNLRVNDLLWNSVADVQCNNLKGYNIYYAPHSGQSLTLLTFLTDTTYIHNMIDSSLAGCYEIKAVNYKNVESAASNRICIDNCVYYRLPDLVTRDNNGHNDIFQAYPIPLGVRSVTFSVYNRWGNQVYRYEGEPAIDWRTTDGADNFLSEGVYYYEADVHYYRRLNPDDEEQKLKGWVHLLGDKEAPKK